MYAVIATHAIYGYGNQRVLDRFVTPEARSECVSCALLAPMCPRGRAAGGIGVMPLSCAIGQPKAGELLFALGLDDLLAAIETVRADMVT